MRRKRAGVWGAAAARWGGRRPLLLLEGPLLAELRLPVLLLGAGRGWGAAGGDANGFCDLGGGKGQLALAAARAEPERLGGRCVSLELVPELHRIGAAAMVAAALTRTEAVRGDIYDLDTLSACVAGARAAYCYSSLLESTDGVHVERLSAALAASRLPQKSVVATINRKLCAEDGWRVGAALWRAAGNTLRASSEGRGQKLEQEPLKRELQCFH